MIRKTLKYYFSTEGETEKWYLDYLEKIINSSHSLYKVSLESKKDSPIGYAKRVTIIQAANIYNVFDIESTKEQDINHFRNTLNYMKKAEKLGKSIKYKICYSNLTFELWMILHKMNFNKSLVNKKDYLVAINKGFNVKFKSLDEYKEEKHFKALLSKITIDDVKQAVKRANNIMKQNGIKYQQKNNNGYMWYEENPSTEVGVVVGQILQKCGLY